jgi:hypothetical protein
MFDLIPVIKVLKLFALKGGDCGVLSGQEIQSPTSQQMEMEMKNDLAAAPLHVEEQPVARLSNGIFLGHLLRPNDHFGNDLAVFLFEIVEASNVLFGDDQKMNRGVGADILKNN